MPDLPEGLTCARCHMPFNGANVRRTDEGWVHIMCPSGCTVPGCERRHQARGLCLYHYKRNQRHGHPLGGTERNNTPRAELIEDVEWMVETGECLTGAARRLNRTPQALEGVLGRAGRRDLYRALSAREWAPVQGWAS